MSITGQMRGGLLFSMLTVSLSLYFLIIVLAGQVVATWPINFDLTDSSSLAVLLKKETRMKDIWFLLQGYPSLLLLPYPNRIVVDPLTSWKFYNFLEVREVVAPSQPLLASPLISNTEDYKLKSEIMFIYLIKWMDISHISKIFQDPLEIIEWVSFI